MKLSHVLVVAGGLLAAATASFADDNSATLGDRLANGSMSQQQFQQLIQFTGLSAEEAKTQTLDEVVSQRWQDN
jgi:hypothetical protein